MKRKIQILSFFFLAAPLFASTNVPNSITGDTQWNADGSPYVIQGKAVVAKGSTLTIGPNVKVVFQGPAALEVDGSLSVAAAAAAPAVFDMTDGGLKSEVFLNGADAHIENAKFVSGVFLVQDSQLHLQWFEITKGSGLYLRGSTTAVVKNGKIYGNATGVVLDGKTKATLQFDTITQNTYGLLLKSYSGLEFKNNSIHDNDKEVVNNTSALNLGGNFWGTDDDKAVAAKIQGSVDLKPLKTLKDILRVYVRTQLPVITKEMSNQLAQKEKREEKALAQKAKTSNPQAPSGATAAPPAPETAATNPPPATTAESTPPETEAPVEGSQSAKVKELPAAAHTLSPMDNLPPDQGNVAESPASAPPSTSEAASEGTASPAPPSEAPLPPSAAAGTEAPPVPPSSDNSVPAPPSNSNSASTSTDTIAPPPGSDNSVPVPPEVSGSTSPSGQASSPASNSTTAPPPPVPESIAPPDIESSTAPSNSAPAGNTAPATANKEAVPAPPDLNEQVTPNASSTTSNPPSTPAQANPPAVPADQTTTAAPPAVPSVSTQSIEDQQKAAQSLDGITGDIDGMQAPPLDIDVPGSSTTNGTDNSAPASQSSNNSGVILPPIKDSDVAPPKDLDLPPTDDLGNMNLDSKNK